MAVSTYCILFLHTSTCIGHAALWQVLVKKEEFGTGEKLSQKSAWHISMRTQVQISKTCVTCWGQRHMPVTAVLDRRRQEDSWSPQLGHSSQSASVAGCAWTIPSLNGELQADERPCLSVLRMTPDIVLWLPNAYIQTYENTHTTNQNKRLKCETMGKEVEEMCFCI